MQRSSILWILTVLAVPFVTVFGDRATVLLQEKPVAETKAEADPPKQQDKKPQSKAEKKPDEKSQATPADLSWMPKEETGVFRFLKEHPEADGRGTVVAIFDTGLDPGAVGLQTCPDGSPKVIDIVDGTGSGDVELKDPVKAEGGQLTGLTGRTLKVSDKWKNPKGEYRLGMKLGYELFPSELVSVIKAEREEQFRRAQHKHRTELARKLAAFKDANPKPDDAKKGEQKELEAQVELIDEMLKSYSDPGPIYDCVVFHDGEHYQAVVDTDEDGDLAEEKVMTNFRVNREYGTFADPINMNFGVNLYEDGKVLSIVCDTGAHGTHVAGIVAAYFPENPEWNGVAPGAQIVSVKIGDTRLDGMESGPGLVRGLQTVLENKCDLINMSYGEPSRTPNSGRVAELYSEIVTDHDVIFVSSAGNAGPALTTVGAPGGTTSAILGVGAYLSPQMMRSEYSIRESLPGLPYTWTSRGPTADGDMGVDIYAPGGAIAPVPLWTRQVNQQMNGTSMASPNACGNIALLLSAAKQNKLKYNPFSVRKAIQNSAEAVHGDEVFAAGPGLIQVDKAWNFLQSHADQAGQRINFGISIPSLHNARGVYLREPHQTERVASYRVTITPEFPEGTSIEDRLGVNLYCKLKTTAEWVTSGDLLHLNHGGNRFEIEVDPTELEPGVHFAEVMAYPADGDESTILFRVPVTVVVPIRDAEIEENNFSMSFEGEFAPGQIQRHFFDVPSGATWAEVKMKVVDTPDVKFFRLHTLQLIDGQDFEEAESGTYFQLIPEVETVHAFPVVGERTLEVTLGQYWSILGNSTLEYSVHFHGLQPDDASLTLFSGQGTTEVTVSNELLTEKVSPEGSLTDWRTIVEPKSSEIRALSADRDTLPNGKTAYELKLTYEFKQDSKGRATLHILPWEDLLYDSQVGPFVYGVFDSNGQRVATNDMFPDAATFEKGTYKVEVITQHADYDTLSEYEKTPLTIVRPLSSPISLKFWSSPATAATGDAHPVGGVLPSDDALTFFVAEPSASSLPKQMKSGDSLHGSIKYSGEDGAATHYTVRFFYSKPEESSSTASSSDKKSLEDKIRDLRLAHLKTLDPTSDEFKKLQEELQTEKADDPQPLITALEKLDSDDKRKERLEAVIAAADKVIASIDQDKLAAQLGRRVPEDDKEARKAHDEAEKQKKQLVDALYRKARAIAYRELPDVVEKTPIADQAAQDKAFDEALKALSVWVDPSEKDYFLLTVRKERRKGHYAQAIQLLNKQINSEAPFLYYKKRLDMFGQLEWKAWQDWQQKQLLIQFPEKQPPYDSKED